MVNANDLGKWIMDSLGVMNSFTPSMIHWLDYSEWIVIIIGFIGVWLYLIAWILTWKCSFASIWLTDKISSVNSLYESRFPGSAKPRFRWNTLKSDAMIKPFQPSLLGVSDRCGLPGPPGRSRSGWSCQRVWMWAAPSRNCAPESVPSLRLDCKSCISIYYYY